MSLHARVASMLAVAIATLSLSTSVAALSPNESILLYRSGAAVTGTLAHGVWTKKRSFALSGVTLAAASRDTLVLYNRDTGKLRTGTFRKGVFTPVATRTIRTGYRRMVASCDSLLLYEPASGRATTAILVGGRMRQPESVQLRAGFSTMGTSCDTVVFEDPLLDRRVTGVLVGGLFTETEYLPANNAITGTILAGTATSLLTYGLDNCGTPACGGWGRLVGGVWDLISLSGGFADYTLAAGTASTIMFYEADGLAAFSTLAGGDYLFVGTRQFARGWKIIVGGR